MNSGAIAAATFLTLAAGAQAVAESQSASVVTRQLPQATNTVPPPGQQKNPFDNLAFTSSRLDPKSIVTPQPGAPEPKIRRIAPPPCPKHSSEQVEVKVRKPPAH